VSPLLLAVLALAGAPAPAAAGSTPWVVVRKDGARVTFAEPPARRGGRLVGRLAGAGTLVSIPEARVDDEATRRANRPGAIPPRSKAKPTPKPWETPPLGDQVKLRRSAEEARRLLESVRGGTAAAPSATPAATDLPASTAPTDRFGRGEREWRERAAGAREEIESAAAELADAEAALEAAERAYLGETDAERTTFVVQVLEARRRAEAARAEHRRARARWEDLQEEARKAGAYPGWLR